MIRGIHGTVATVQSRVVEFKGEVGVPGYRLVTYFRALRGITVQRYEPRYQKG